MRVLISCLQSLRRHPIPAYDFWRRYFTKGCEEAGMEFVEIPGVDWAEALIYPAGKELDEWRTRTWEMVLAFVRREHNRQPLDFFLTYLYPQQVEVTAIIELQRLGIPCVNFFCDNVREFHRVPKEYYPFALHWVPEFEALPMYRSANLPHLHAPMPCWVSPKLRDVVASETEDPTFIGSADILRRDLLGRALQIGAHFIVRGPGWALETNRTTSGLSNSRSVSRTITNQLALIRSHGLLSLLYKMESRLHPMHPPRVPASKFRDAVFGDEYIRVTREATVTIGINRVPTPRTSNYRPIAYSRLRDLEAPMLGACYLTEWTAGLEEMYELGTEIETYRNAEELSAKLMDLTKNHERRINMRKRAQRRSLHDHSVARSLGRISAQLGL